MIIVIFIFAVLIIFGAAIMTFALSAYKTTIASARSRQNQYFSEMGINTTKAILGVFVSKGIEEGNKAVYNKKKEIEKQRKNKDIKFTEESIKEMLKEAFYKGYNDIQSGNNQPGYESTLKNLIINNKQDDNFLKVFHKGLYNEKYINSLNCLIKEQKNRNIKVKLLNKKIQFTDKVLSLKFNSRNSKSKGINFTVNIRKPNYTAYVKECNIDKNKALDTCIFSNGQLNVNSNVDIYGDIYVKGLYNKGINFTKPGIKLITYSDEELYYGKISTANNIILTKDNSLNSSGDIFASSIILNGFENSILKNNNSNGLKSKNVYLKNDLMLNGKNNNVNILGDLYGFNHIIDKEQSQLQRKNASSILINDLTNTSFINIHGNLYLMGTGYVKSNKNLKDYQTGESVAVKGNYRAYTHGLNKNIKGQQSLKKDNIKFSNKYSPFYFAEEFKDGTKLNVQDKARYFKGYTEENKNSEEIIKPNIKVKGKVYSVGAVINNEKISVNNCLEPQEELKKKQNEYQKEIYGQEYLDYSTNPEPINIKDIIDFSKKDFNKTSINNESKDIVYMNNSLNELFIQKGNKNKLEYNTLTLKNNQQGIIIANCDINIKAPFEFTGTIISGGSINLISNDDEKIIIRQGKQGEFSLKDFINNRENFKNYFKGVFIDSINKDYDDKYEKIDIKDIISSKNLDGLIKVVKWKIVR